MNVKNLMLLLALAGLGTACSNDDGMGGNDPQSGTGNEIQLVFSGSSDGTVYTKAIASAEENAIDNLDVYVFASDRADGTYYYLEKWGMGVDDKTNKTFSLKDAGTSKQATLYPGELVNLPYLKLYCVANPQAKLFEKDGTTELTLSQVTAYDNVTGAPSPANATLSTAFEEAVSESLDAVTMLHPSLVMTGSGLTKISGSVSKVEIELKRIVARFDIDNNTQTSQLTIDSISIGQGRKNGKLFSALDATADKIETADFATKLMTYAGNDFTSVLNHNQGIGESALYTYPSLASDSAYLIIKGKYKSPDKAEQIAVTYHVPLVKTLSQDPAVKPEYISINRNSRYKLRITDVTNSNIYGTFEVVDWTSAGGVIIKPENEAPVFNGALDLAAVTGTVPEQDATDPSLYKLTDDAGEFTLRTIASSNVTATVALTKADAPWLTLKSTKDPVAVDSLPGMMETVFTFSYTDATGKLPCKVTFRNDAGNWDPACWTVVTFAGPYATPVLSAVTPTGTLGNVVELTDPAAPAATMYKAKDSEIKIKAMCIDGITTTVTPSTGVSITEVETKDYITTYSIKITDTTLVTTDSVKVEFKNAKSDAGKALITLPIAIKSAALTLAEGANSDNAAADYTDIANGNIKVDTDLLSIPTDKSFTFKVNSPLGLTAPDFSTCKWLTITESQAWSEGNGYAEYTVKMAATPVYAGSVDAFTFTNKLANAGDVTVTFVKLPSKPNFAANDGTETNSAYNDAAIAGTATAATTEMYLLNGSTMYVKATCAEAFTVESPDATGMTVTQEGGDNIYKIVIIDATKFTADGSAIVKAKNSSDATRESTLSIKLLDPKMKVELNGTPAFVTPSTEGDDLVYTVTYNDMTNAGVNFSVTSPFGATVDVSSVTNTWLRATTAPGTIAKGDTEIYVFKAGDDDTQTGDITVEFKSLLGGPNQKIIFRKL